MSDSTFNGVTDEELRKAFVGNAATTKKPLKQPKKKIVDDKKIFWICTAFGATAFVVGCIMLICALAINTDTLVDNSTDFSFEEKKEEAVYSGLTGEVLADASLKTAPTYCIQVPNGLDGARPQAGLNEAGVVFEAIAEAGITRFAAIYQNPTASVIGPIRSLRMYYLEWDTPFDCTIVHAGGAADALAMVSTGGYRDLTEDYQYMYRGTNGGRAWNNLFTTSNSLKSFNESNGYGASDVKGFSRLTPAESNQERVDHLAKEKLIITKPSAGNTSEIVPETSSINVRFGGLTNFNVKYDYDVNTNTYLRSYENGDGHMVYNCPAGETDGGNPENTCSLVQMAPNVVVAMVVSERRAADNYHEIVDTIGSGTAYIFQNGIAIQGSWRKTSRSDQIKFTDNEGKEIKLAPGQTYISAVPSYGSVDF